MPLHTIQHSFAGGETGAELDARADLNRYFSSLQLCENYRTTPQGGVIRRDGTQFIGEAKFSDKQVRLELFEFSVEQAYTLELGDKYIRFYRGLNRLEDPPGMPVEVVTPYLEDELFDIQIIQSADIAFFTHPDHPPQELQRRSDTDWRFLERIFLPPPSAVARTFLDATLTLSGTTGEITATLSAQVGDAFFLDGDVDRALTSLSGGAAIIKELVGAAPATVATLTTIVDFTSVGPFVTTEWFLSGSPTVTLVFDKVSPRGAQASVQAEALVTNSPNEITNGDFALGQTGWDNLSAPLVTSGTHTGPTSADLQDTTKDFVAAGVEVGHIGTNLTKSVTGGRVDTFSTDTNPNDTIIFNPTMPATWAGSNLYELHTTGAASFSTGSMRLSAEENGIGHAEQNVTGLVPNSRYRLTFDDAETSVVLRIGTTSGGIEITPKTTFSTGATIVFTFSNGAATSIFIGFSNEQSLTTSEIDSVMLQRVSASAFRDQDKGKLIVGQGGTAQILAVIDAENIDALILSVFTGIEVFSIIITGTLTTFLLVSGLWLLEENVLTLANGFPRGQTFHQGRLWYLATKSDPLTAWGSKTGEPGNFARGTLANDALAITISANAMNTLEWGEPFRDLLIGTRGGEHMITSGTEGAITPANAGQIPQGTAGSPPLRPIRTDSILIHLQRGRRRVREIAIDPDVVQLSQARDLTVLNPGITRSGIRQWTFQQQPYQTLWAVREDGVLIGLTLDIIENVRGWHRHTTKGKIKSVVRIPVDNSLTEATEQIWWAVERTIGGISKTFIEVQIPKQETDTEQRAELTVDSALRYDGALASTFSGLDHLEGETVRLVSRDDVTITLPTGETVQADKLTDLGEQVVTGGQVTTDDPVSKLDVGLAFTSKLQTLRPEIAQKDEGTTQGRKVRWVRLMARLINSLGLQLNGETIPFREVDDIMDAGLLPRNEDVFTAGGISDWSDDGRLLIEQTLPLPSTILGLVGDIEMEEVE